MPSSIHFLLVAAMTLVPVGRWAGSRADERELLLAFKEAFAAEDPAARAAAVIALGDGSRSLPDKGAGKRVAQALVKGLEDAELEVCQAALFQLGGREVETVIGAMETFLRDVFRELEGRVGKVDDRSLDYVERGSVVLENGCHLFASYRDDRTVALLVALLSALEADTKKNDLGSRLVGGLATATLALGTEAAAEAAVKQTKTFSGPAQTAGGRKLHDALAAFATGKGMTPPEWSETYSEQWFKWLEANRNQLPKKLGKLTTPPSSEAGKALAGLPGKRGQ